MSTHIPRPGCFGLLYEVSSPDCACCLLAEHCKVTVATGPVPAPKKTSDAVDVPKDKKSLILAVCARYGIPAEYKEKSTGKIIAVNEGNKHEFVNLDFLLTTKSALAIFLQTEIQE